MKQLVTMLERKASTVTLIYVNIQTLDMTVKVVV